jgi:hypothetical protein
VILLWPQGFQINATIIARKNPGIFSRESTTKREILLSDPEPAVIGTRGYTVPAFPAQS